MEDLIQQALTPGSSSTKSLLSIGTQTSAFANPRVLVSNNQRLTSNSSLEDMSLLKTAALAPLNLHSEDF